jgi:protein phosphatase
LNLTFASNSLIILCGPAGSGKSTFASRFFPTTQTVSSDECRTLISDDPADQQVSADAFELLHTIVRFRLKYGRLTVVDATNLIGEYRTPLIRLAEAFRRPIYLVLFKTDFETCLRQNALRSRCVARDVIENHQAHFSHIAESIRGEPYCRIDTIESADFDKITVRIESLDETQPF